jgi:hypothetical protein
MDVLTMNSGTPEDLEDGAGIIDGLDDVIMGQSVLSAMQLLGNRP